MKKIACVISAFIWLLCTATTCDEMIDPEVVTCTILDLYVYNLNNEGEGPRVSLNDSVKREAYMLQIELKTDFVKYKNELECRIEDRINHMKIYTIQDLNQDNPKDSDITNCFANHPDLRYQMDNFYLALIKLPDKGIHQFKVVVELESGKQFERVTKPVELY